MRTTAREKKLIQLAGEYAVASELCRRGVTALVMSEGWPGYDIMARTANGWDVQLQVKTRGTKTKKALVPKGDCLYAVVFVQLWEDRPAFFPVPGPDVERLRDEAHARYVETHPNANPAPGAGVPQVAWADLEPYADQWDAVLDNLGDEQAAG